MKTLLAAFIALCLCVSGALAKTCADRGGVLVFTPLLGGGWVCMKPPGKIPLEKAKP